ncbi:MAG TPA: ABC transporter permease [Planctomycetota bacterium]
MSTLARKLAGDLWQQGARARTVSIVLAVTAGVAAFATLLSSHAILTREVARGYEATRPADVTLHVDSVDDELVATVRAVEGVLQADARRVVKARIRTGPIQWRALQLIAPRSFADVAVSRFLPQQGAWPPAAGELLVERDALQVAKACIGDVVTVRVGGVEHSLRIAGTVHDPGQAQARMEDLVYGYVTRETLALLGEATELDRLLLAVDGGASAQRSAQVRAGVGAVLAAAGQTMRGADHSTGHPHASLMDLLFRVQLAAGDLVLLLAAFVAVQLFTAQMATQVRQIGVMKALGARPSQLARVFLGQAAVLGLAASLLAWPLGAFGARVLTAYMAMYLNFDLDDASAPASVLLLEVAVGIALPLLAAAWPVWRGVRMPVGLAIVQHGVRAPVFGRSLLDRLLARAGGPRVARPLLFALRNTLRRRGRTALNVGTLAVGGVAFLSACDLRTSMIGTLDRLFAQRRYDLSVGLGSLQSFAAAERAANATSGVAAVEGWIITPATLVRPDGAGDLANPAGGHAGIGPSHLAAMRRLHAGANDGSGSAGPTFYVQAPPAGTRMWAPSLVAGSNLEPSDTGGILVNDALAALAGNPPVGSELSLQLGPLTKPWRIAGVVREPFAPPGAWVSQAVFAGAGHDGMANTLRLALRTKDPDSVAAIEAELERNLAREGITASSSLATASSRFSFDQHFVMVYECLLAIAGLVLLVGGLGLLSALGLGLIDRRNELGVLRALGASPRTVGLVVLAEGCFVALAAWGLSLTAAWVLTSPGGLLLLFPRRLERAGDPWAPFAWLGVALLIGVVASLVPAWRARRISVREALARA